MTPCCPTRPRLPSPACSCEGSRRRGSAEGVYSIWLRPRVLGAIVCVGSCFTVCGGCLLFDMRECA